MSIMSILSKFVFILILIRTFIKKRFRNLSYLAIITPFFLLLAYLTIKNSFDVLRLFPIFMKLSGIILLFTPYIYRNPKLFVKVLRHVLTLILFLNFIQMIFLPNIIGNGSYLIASNYNQFAPIVSITILLSYIDFKYHNNYISLFATFLLSLATVAIPGSLTATLSVTLLIGFMLFKISEKLRRTAIVFTACATLIFLVVVVISQSILSNNTILDDILISLGKDISFSGRDNMWLNAILAIIESPMLGWGYYDSEWASINIQGVNPHNLTLNLMIHGGYILLGYFILFLVYVIYNVHKLINNKVRLSLYFSIVIFILMSQMEVYNYFMIFFFFYLVYSFSKFTFLSDEYLIYCQRMSGRKSPDNGMLRI